MSAFLDNLEALSEEVHVVDGNYLGAETEDLHDMLWELRREDVDEFNRLSWRHLQSGSCALLLHGGEVNVLGVIVRFGGGPSLVRLRRVGEEAEYWTPLDAVEIDLQ